MSTSKPPERPTTLLESIEDVRQELRSQSIGDEVLADGAAEQTLPYRPSARPPMAALFVYDDDPATYEVVRIRSDSFVIGRGEGDLSIDHDQLISAQHAEITRVFEKGSYLWYLSDLGSTNGTFARVSHVILTDRMMFILGSQRYRFELGETEPESTAVPNPAKVVKPEEGTRHWKQLSSQDLGKMMPSLVAVTADGDGERFAIREKTNWIGRDPSSCSFVISDPTVGSRHARLFQDEHGRWCMEPTKTRNGLWAQIHQVPLGRGGQFQCGEQRFSIRII